MLLQERIQALAGLGNTLKTFVLHQNNPQKESENLPLFYTDYKQALEQSYAQNGWFTPENILFCWEQWGQILTENSLKKWLSPYPIPAHFSQKKVLIIMAGNIPLVGFHDLLCVLVSGHKALVKLSSNDKILLPALVQELAKISPALAQRVTFIEDTLSVDFDAVIATGSNNTARYFEYYFAKKPHIIRKNRNSVAVLMGNETPEELTALGEDIFRYFGLGCRSVSKLFVPEGYDFNAFFKAIYPYAYLLDNQKYVNNYDYNKAVYLMSLFPLLENGFLLLKQDTHYASPIATVFYDFYPNPDELRQILTQDAQQIQCIVAKGFCEEEIPFGQTQKPQLSQYADAVDTLDFLCKL